MSAIQTWRQHKFKSMGLTSCVNDIMLSFNVNIFEELYGVKILFVPSIQYLSVRHCGLLAEDKQQCRQSIHHCTQVVTSFLSCGAFIQSSGVKFRALID